MERETLEVDVLLVGAGPASLACAYRLASLASRLGTSVEILVIEKGSEVGQHLLSGAVLDPRALDELFDGKWREAGCPVEARVTREAAYYLTASRRLRFPVLPPPLRNHGSYVVTLSHVSRWLREKCEELGVMVLEGFPGSEILWDGDRVAGVRTADKGLDATGAPKAGFTPGTDIRANVTVLGEGSRGSLTKVLVERLGLGGPNPQIYATGVKEVWELPEDRVPPGQVMHTTGWPLRGNHYGGGWIYGMPRRRVSIGFVPALDYRDPRFDPWQSAQLWKTHPWIRSFLDGGRVLIAGAKTLPEGGYWSQPKLYGDGFVVVGDGASFLNAPRLKGIHTAVKSGMLAAEAILSACERGRFDGETLSVYQQLYRESWLYRELHRVRNVRQAFRGNFLLGMLRAGVLLGLGGRLFVDRAPVCEDAAGLVKVESLSNSGTVPPISPPAADPLVFDKPTGVHHAGALHEEDQPGHLKVADTDICRTRCREEYGNPCENFCPANVYEMVEDPHGEVDPRGTRPQKLQIHHSNCVHCKTCDIMDPYGIITWTVPSDAGGPRYLGM